MDIHRQDPASQAGSPKAVRLAVTCLATSTALSAVLTIVYWTGLLALPVGGSNFTNGVTCAWLALATWKIAAGRGWARWLFIAFYVLGSVGMVIIMLVKPEVLHVLPTVLIASAFTQLGLQTAALIFLLSGGSPEWFRSKRTRPTAPSAGAGSRMPGGRVD